uniref:Uncharacterized protein n=1 Tax=Romanomermis culicivorax TaxID=13658 RepID=A0A915K9M8_ROMCU
MAEGEIMTVQRDENYNDEDDDETSTTSSTTTSSSKTTTSPTETATTTLTSRTASSGAVYHTTEMVSDGAVSPRIDEQDRKGRRKQGVQKSGYTEMRNIANGMGRVEEPPSSSLIGQPKLQSMKSSRSLESVRSTLAGNNKLSSSHTDSRQRRISENLDGKRHEDNADIFRWSSDSSHSSIPVQLDLSINERKKKPEQHVAQSCTGQPVHLSVQCPVQQNNDSGDYARPDDQTGVVCVTVPVLNTSENQEKCIIESAVQVDMQNVNVGRPTETNKMDMVNSPIFKNCVRHLSFTR